jgi:hypothetical protein
MDNFITIIVHMDIVFYCNSFSPLSLHNTSALHTHPLCAHDTPLYHVSCMNERPT